MIIQTQNKHPLILSSLISPADYRGREEIYIRSCTVDADDSLVQGLFICLEKDPAVARRQVAKSLARGAVAVALSREVLTTSEIAADDRIFEVGDPRDVLGRACQALLDYPAKKIKTIAVTGTAGKTSLTYLLAGMLAESGAHVGLIGSLGTFDGRSLCPETERNASPETLAESLALMVDNGCDYVLLEVSSVALDQNRFAGIEFDAICLTNIRRDHLDYHGSLDAYRRAKMKIFDHASDRTLVVCNTDDRVTDAILHLITHPTITVGMHPTDGMVSGMLVEQNNGGQTFYIVAGTDAVPVHTRMIGTEHLYNCLLAAALGIGLGISLKTIVPGIERVQHIPGRMEQIDCGQACNVFVDNAATPEGIEGSLKSVASVTTGRVFCVLGTDDADDQSRNAALARAASAANITVLTAGNGNPVLSAVDLQHLFEGFEPGDREVRTMPRRRDALVWALSEASPDDSVLVLGSDGPTSDPRSESLSDRQFVRNWLYENQPCMEPFWF